MSDHNFEKQIQQKLDELKIPPADTVWSGVEAQIRRDRRRRRRVIFFPFLFLLIGAGCYFIFQDALSSRNHLVTKSSSQKSNPYSDNSTSENSKTVKEQAKKDRQEDNSDNTPKQSVTGNAENTGISKKEIPGSTIGSKKAGNRDANPEDNTANTKKISVPVAESSLEKDFKNNTAGRRNRKQQDKNRIEKGNIKDQVFADQNINGNNLDKIIDQEKKSEAISPVRKQDKTIVPGPDSMANQTISDIAVARVTDSTVNNHHLNAGTPADTLLSDKLVEENKVTDTKIKQPGWRWGLIASAGISNLMDDGFFNGFFDDVLGGEKALVADVSRSSLNSAPGTSGPPVVVHKPSAIEKGFSFSAGAFVQNHFSKRFSVSTGVGYRQYSNRIQVGNRVDNGTILQLQNAFGSLNVSQYYSAAPVTSTHKYTNRFHFIELPVAFDAQLNRSNRLPLYWNTGLSLSYMVSTNALHFDGNTGIYYKDNGLFNKLQANLSTGFSLSLWTSSKFPINIGPQFQYGLSNLMKREVSASKHLFYFGLNTRIYFKK